ncbi:MAG: primase protein [Parcubacteria group bacterium GW2011_GWC1_43_11b]|uniref:DNA primase n=2 Tax=Candidatus Vogeliibacteriota TaxID=1817922 RepID=A0A1G2QCA2_9BACT|nr:MAG: primase protein [Parcubacteria group bacterium GW2011_GWB1_42_9]KKS89622.1 MAG: primase protein [Parcubacteria group bacterium GW2011_GWC1_43_11b]KKT10073.1 MAG: primase protein [Parcubacteria group bacterium GW2011_GWA1_43_21]OHA58058.1 MAG: DNA primase [Candidatus Vogelbacteria bacterium RIFOXYB1_FULL_42_16]OHA58328.1 MAG: DNA primase [Candidatus Vogelbacteria bacterium RIFOXYD1_FULL_42_15]
MSSTVEQIKARLSIDDVVGSYLKLEKAGLNFRARCPFHNEKTPSFFVSPSRQSYHCFGCNKGGDIFTFVQDIEGVDFLGALKILAERAGVEIVNDHRDGPRPNERLFQLMALATKFYQEALGKNQPVLAYLADRGIKTETQKHFQIGFAPDGWRQLHDFLLGQGFILNEMLETGMVIKAERTTGVRGEVYYDRFRSRIMFPLSDSAGRIVGFSGRIFPAGRSAEASAGPEVAKYVNSPQTFLFDKSRLLFGYDKAKVEMRRHDFAILVEGQVDLIMSHQAGLANTIAGSGTALSPEQITLIGRMTKNLIMAYDYDLAGLKASRRAITLAQGAGLNVKIAKLPAGQDPAEVIKKDPQDWLSAIKNSKHHIDFLIDALLAEGKTGLELSRLVNENVLPIIKALGKKMEQAHFVAKLSQLLGIGEEAIWSDLANLRLEPDSIVTNRPPTDQTLVSDTRSSAILNKIFGLIFWLESLPERAVDPNQLIDRLKEIIGPDSYQAEREVRIKKEGALVMEAEFFFQGSEKLQTEILELFNNLHLENLREQLREAMQALKKAEAVGDQLELDKWLKKCQAITLELNQYRK